MIERIDNIIQLVLTGGCTAYGIFSAVRTYRREWTAYALFCAAFFLGDVYWTLYLVFYGETPDISYIPDLAWLSSYLFLIIMLRKMIGDRDKPAMIKRLWSGPAFSSAMGIYFMIKGDYLSNLLTAVLMGLVIWYALKGIELTKALPRRDAPEFQVFNLAMLFVTIEYLLWISSYYWMGDTIMNPYFWFDFMISVIFVLFIPAIRRVVRE